MSDPFDFPDLSAELTAADYALARLPSSPSRNPTKPVFRGVRQAAERRKLRSD